MPRKQVRRRRPALTATHPESSLERACRSRVARLCGELLKIKAGGGWPDRLVLLPGTRLAFVEFKRGGKTARKLQAYRLEWLRLLGFGAREVDSTEAFKKLLREMGE